MKMFLYYGSQKETAMQKQNLRLQGSTLNLHLVSVLQLLDDTTAMLSVSDRSE
jgi:hypothetical protein